MRFEHLFAKREIWITTLWSISSPFKIWADVVSVCCTIFASNFSRVCLFRYQREIYGLFALYFVYLSLVIFNFQLSTAIFFISSCLCWFQWSSWLIDMWSPAECIYLCVYACALCAVYVFTCIRVYPCVCVHRRTCITLLSQIDVNILKKYRTYD